MNQAVITQLNNRLFFLIYENGELAECHPMQNDQSLQIGNIYIGRVEKVVKNIQSAFIRLDTDHVGYLPLNDKPALILNRKLPKGLPSIAENDLILVQVEQEPQKMKQARVTGNICLNGNYVALDLQESIFGVSKKIKDTERIKELRQLISEEKSSADRTEQPSFLADGRHFVEGSYGCILRTACENADNKAIVTEYKHFTEELNQLIHKATFERKTGCIKKGKPEYLALLENYGIQRFDEIKTDLPEIFETLQNSSITATFYEDKEYSLCKLLSLETEIKKLLSKKVWLKSGGFLIIEPTEAMVVIDVNSGKSIGKKNKDTHILKLNLEAAEEITRQLRLRNLSGIIMIDFINMNSEADKQEIVKCLEKGLRRDKIPGYFVEITKLDVFELTRKKVRKPLHEILFQKHDQ